jgi:FXSXX-COOH protein
MVPPLGTVEALISAVGQSGEGENSLASPLPDVSRIALTELLAQDGSVLQNALERLLQESDTHDVVAGFNAAI